MGAKGSSADILTLSCRINLHVMVENWQNVVPTRTEDSEASTALSVVCSNTDFSFHLTHMFYKEIRFVDYLRETEGRLAGCTLRRKWGGGKMAHRVKMAAADFDAWSPEPTWWKERTSPACCLPRVCRGIPTYWHANRYTQTCTFAHTCTRTHTCTHAHTYRYQENKWRKRAFHQLFILK